MFQMQVINIDTKCSIPNVINVIFQPGKYGTYIYFRCRPNCRWIYQPHGSRLKCFSPTSRQDEGCWQAPVVGMCTSSMSQRKDWRGIIGGDRSCGFVVGYFEISKSVSQWPFCFQNLEHKRSKFSDWSIFWYLLYPMIQFEFHILRSWIPEKPTGS